MIIGLSGYAQSGKDTVAELLIHNYGFQRISFASPIRNAVYTLNPTIMDLDFYEPVSLVEVIDKHGWELAKTMRGNKGDYLRYPDVRRLLQVMGTDVGRGLFGETFWIDQAFKQADAEGHERIVMPDVRFPNEARAIAARSGDVWRINRHNHTPVNAHKSETAMDNFMFKHVIYNDSTLDDLSEEVFMLAREAGLDG